MISVSHYTLHYRASSRQPRQGALLRKDFGDGLYGYADCHPWTEFGDASLEKQLKLLSQGVLTPLTTNSLEFISLDAAARNKKINLFAGLNIPASHYLIAEVNLKKISDIEQALEEKFISFKIKVGRNPSEEIPILLSWIKIFRQHEAKLSLDFNSLLSEEQFKDYLSAFSDGIDLVDYFEDPFPYNDGLWQKCRDEYQIRLAYDMGGDRTISRFDACDVLIVKPAVQNVEFLLANHSDKEIVFTSYLDHPLGQASACYKAAQALKNPMIKSRLCGLLTHSSYEENAFSQELTRRQIGPNLCLDEGTGFGFDQLLQDLTWTKLT